MAFDSCLHIPGEAASMVAVESSANNAMHSEMDRRGGIGAWITATGNLPQSIMIFAAAPEAPQNRWRASTSEMWITWSATPRLYRTSPMF
jgi:hypothetical protein